MRIGSFALLALTAQAIQLNNFLSAPAGSATNENAMNGSPPAGTPEVLAEGGPAPSDEERIMQMADKIMRRMDTDGDDKISWNELVQSIRKQQTEQRKNLRQMMRRQFENVDTDKSGSVNVEELRAYVKQQMEQHQQPQPPKKQ